MGNKAIRSSDSGETFHSLADVPVASQAACGVMVDNNTYLHIGGHTRQFVVPSVYQATQLCHLAFQLFNEYPQTSIQTNLNETYFIAM